ncbi:MAG TPA: hypothetical protein VF251_05890 [Pyrinomonadaceae bacterium]
MKRLLLYSWVSAVSFCVGVLIATSLWPVNSSAEHPKPTVTEVPVSVEPVSGTRDYVDAMHACGPNGNFHAYRLADGSQISVACIKYRSRSAANRAFKQHLGKGKLIPVDAELAGRTILAVPRGFEELRTYGASLCVTNAQSLKQLQLRSW